MANFLRVPLLSAVTALLLLLAGPVQAAASRATLLSAVTATGEGTALDIGMRFVNGFQVVVTGAPSAVVVTLKASNDGTTFSTLGTFSLATMASGDFVIPVQAKAQWMRADLDTLTDGTAPTVTVRAIYSDEASASTELDVAFSSDQLPAALTAGGALKTAAVDAAGNELNYAAPDDATAASVNDAATSATCLATNANRQGARFYNDSTVYAYLLEDEGTASATNFTVRMDPGGLYILPINTSGVYTDDVKCIWASDASGAMRVTEITP